MLKRAFLCFCLSLIAWSGVASASAQDSTYMKPPQNILDVLNAPVPPQVWVSPSRDAMLLGTQLQ